MLLILTNKENTLNNLIHMKSHIYLNGKVKKMGYLHEWSCFKEFFFKLLVEWDIIFIAAPSLSGRMS